jgi:hypothetical protein
MIYVPYIRSVFKSDINGRPKELLAHIPAAKFAYLTNFPKYIHFTCGVKNLTG